MKRFFLILAVLVAISLSTVSRAEVWRAASEWTIEEESRFGAWISEYVDEDFFLNHRIPIDCADVSYGLRWIYARIRRLPASATTTSGEFIGNWSSNWDHLPSHSRWDKDPRFRTALLAVLSLTRTETIPYDTYPIQVTPEFVTPGTLFLSTEAHTGVVGRVILDGSTIHPLQTWEASLPVKRQKLKMRDFLMHNPNAANQSGLIKFRWLEKVDGGFRYLSRKDQPAYSAEQYGPEFFSQAPVYVDAVAKRIDPKTHDPQIKAEQVIDYIVKMLDERIQIVLRGYGYCSENPCAEGSDMWETYSTPIRDRKIRLLFWYLDNLFRQNGLDSGGFLAKMKTTRFDIGNGKTIDLLHIYNNRDWFSYDPDTSIEMRWGLEKCKMIDLRLGTLQEAIEFVDKAYREKDPGYARSTIIRYETEMETLRKEQQTSQCKDALVSLP
jgi:hypothetical protein